MIAFGYFARWARGDLMLVLIAGLVVFFGMHLVRIVAPKFREAQAGQNLQRWKNIYSLVSLVGVGLIIWGWHLFRGEAPEIYNPPSWGPHAAMALVWLALVMLFGSNIKMPAGWIKHLVKHPMLAGVFLWSLAHLMSNGDQASLLLFGSFLAYAVVSGFAMIARGDPHPKVISPRGDIIALVAGTVVYAVFVFWAHGFLFGISPIA